MKIRLSTNCLVAGCLAIYSAFTPAPARAAQAGQASPLQPAVEPRDVFGQQLQAWKNINPVAEADSAAARGDFRLYWYSGMGDRGPVGLICFGPVPTQAFAHTSTEQGNEDLVKEGVPWSDMPGDTLGPIAGAVAAAYNQRLFEKPEFPFSDLCRPPHRGEPPHSERPYSQLWKIPATDRRPPIQTLAQAARMGSLPDTERLLAAGKPANSWDGFGMSPLDWAIVRGHENVARRLIRAGADPGAQKMLNSRDDLWAKNPVFLAATFGRDALYAEIATPERVGRLPREKLIAGLAYMGNAPLLAKLFAADPTPPASSAHEILLPVLAHRDNAVADVLLERAKWSPDEVLEEAVVSSNVEYASRALAAGARANMRMKGWDDTPLYHIASMPSAVSDPELMALLLRHGADPAYRNIGAETPLQVLIRRGPTGGGPPLSLEPRYAGITFAGRTELLQLLIKAGSDVNAPDPSGQPMVMQFLHTYNGAKPSHYALEWLAPLAQAGMNLNLKYHGKTALQFARAGGDEKLVRELVRLGAR
jgi:ankyrin repeat protein